MLTAPLAAFWHGPEGRYLKRIQELKWRGVSRTLNGETQMELVELIKKYPDRHANIQSSRAMGNRGKGRQGVAGTKEAKENGEEGRRSLLKANLVRISLVKASQRTTSWATGAIWQLC
jgi:hypothetical protein